MIRDFSASSDICLPYRDEEVPSLLAKLLDLWNIPPASQPTLTSLSEPELLALRSGGGLPSRRDVWERACRLLTINNGIRALEVHQRREMSSLDPVRDYSWVTRPNSTLGVRPVDLILEEGNRGAEKLIAYIKARFRDSDQRIEIGKA